jgi:hypothetical protein
LLRKQSTLDPKALSCGWTLTNKGVYNKLTKQLGDEYGQLVFDTVDPDTTSIVTMEKILPLPLPAKKELIEKQQHTHDLVLDF